MTFSFSPPAVYMDNTQHLGLFAKSVEFLSYSSFLDKGPWSRIRFPLREENRQELPPEINTNVNLVNLLGYFENQHQRGLMKVSTYPDGFTRDERPLAVGFTDKQT
ncbi:MAG TPA: hypothetical protein DCP92_04075 [Nitrospiraceae bacterium]|jgi:hypothetical protein|nr:hypothetical protein [Nitrospiraceae bacterium]